MHEHIADFLRYWVNLRGAEELPARGQVDPLTIPRHLLSKVFLMAYDQTRDDIRFTLVGSHIYNARGTEISGKYISDLPSKIGGSQEAFAEHLRELYRLAGRRRRPVHSRGMFRWFSGEAPVVTERMTCPILSQDAVTVEFTGVQVYERQSMSPNYDVRDANDYVPEFVRVLEDPDSLLD